MTISFKIPMRLTELTLDITLQCGQSFRWFKTSNERWRGVIGANVWTLHQDTEFMYCEVSEEKNSVLEEVQDSSITNKHDLKPEHYETVISKYFRLDVPLKPLYERWSEVDPNFQEKAVNFPGVRILDQDPVENTFSFICSSNNNIQRITSLVDKLCKQFGTHIATLDGHDHFAFPSVSSLAKNGTESKLKELGFGYRAKYIATSAKIIMEKGGEEWLRSLRTRKYEDCRESLTILNGIGEKVADCICLMSMGHLDAIPVDTHVFQIAARDYLPHLQKSKTVTKKIYKEIVDHFQELFGSYAGWAHSVLFSSNLKKFQPKENQTTKSKKSKKTSFAIEKEVSVKRAKNKM